MPKTFRKVLQGTHSCVLYRLQCGNPERASLFPTGALSEPQKTPPFGTIFPRVGSKWQSQKGEQLVRQRLSIPGGCCSFDLPTLHIWLHMPQAHRDEQVASWLASLDPLVQSLSLILDLIRNSALFRKQTSLNGFYQDNGEDADLLRLRLDLAHQLYPQISGHKSRFAIRFLALDSEYGIVPERFDFELACC